MFEELTMSQLRSQIEQHLMMVEEVLGGMDTFIQRLEKRVSRIEEGLGSSRKVFRRLVGSLICSGSNRSCPRSAMRLNDHERHNLHQAWPAE